MEEQKFNEFVEKVNDFKERVRFCGSDMMAQAENIEEVLERKGDFKEILEELQKTILNLQGYELADASQLSDDVDDLSDEITLIMEEEGE